MVFSDDLTMKAVRDNFTLAEQVEQATRAEVDVMLACSDLDLQWQVWEELVKIQEQNSELAAAAARSAERVHTLRLEAFADRPALPDLSEVGCEAHQALARSFAALA